LRREKMSESPITVSVAKVVKLGTDTLLVIAVEGTDVLEGEYTIRSIEATPQGLTATRGASACGIQVG
jgi:hypothetical protein